MCTYPKTVYPKEEKMKGTRFNLLSMLVLIMSAMVLLPVIKAAAGDLPATPNLRVVRVSLGFYGDEKLEALGVAASYDVDPATGCIQNFYDKEDNRIDEDKKPPDWVAEGKDVVYFTSPSDLQCRQSIIAVKGSPIEIIFYANGHYYCIGAWDPECPPVGKWYQPCQPSYPTCP